MSDTLPITREAVLLSFGRLSHGATVYHRTLRNSDGTPLRARVNGRIKTWKTRPGEFQLPMKHGLRDCFYITDRDAAQWAFTEVEAQCQKD